jgi:hypothetical protein
MTKPDFLFNVTPGDVCYDIETYPNVFTLKATHVTSGQKWTFEISFRRNDAHMLRLWMDTLRGQGCRMVGFNNIGFDYPVIHYIYNYEFVTVADIYAKAMSIINGPYNARFSHMVWESDWVVSQIDLFKIHHFDNVSKATSLKVLEFNMRMDNIEDLPFPVGTDLTSEQIDVLLEYNDHDVTATGMFLGETTEQIRFREELSERYDKNFMNYNDTKIGSEVFIIELEKHKPGCCYQKIDGRKQAMQTPRDSIDLGEVMLPYIKFEHPEFQRVHHWFSQQVITETKGSIKDIHCTIQGFKFDFGTGGIHGATQGRFESDDEYIIESRDVKSYYPNLSIQNHLFPAHLGEEFCNIYEGLYIERGKHPKGSAENAMLKLALNGTYGNSNNKYSPFYDPHFTMAITIGGQLSLCMLCEQLLKVPTLEMLMINTDGLEYRVKREYTDHIEKVCQWWENLTKLELETSYYHNLFIRDCNNYIGEYNGGGLKRKGAYEYELDWHQNHSALVVPKAVEAVLIRGEDVREFIENHEDVMDFMLRAKVPRDSIIEWGGDKVANIVRYYISTEGDILEKVMPAKGEPGQFKRANSLSDEYYNGVMEEIGMGVWDERVHTKNRSIYEERRSGINTGWTVRICNKLKGHTFADINYEWYIQEADKLISCML